MPEGDTLFRVARTLHRALGEQIVRQFDAAYAPLLRIAEEAPLVGRTVQRAEARGKWCLIWLGPRVDREPAPSPRGRGRWDGPLALCTHLRMNGMWHIYRPGEKWQRSSADMRVLLVTDPFVAVGFRVPVAELLNEQEVEQHAELGQLGPDLLGEKFDESEALRRLRTQPDLELGEALLQQRLAAGLGNVYKSEVCFLMGLSPFAPVRTVSDDALRQALSIGRRLLRENSRPTGEGAVVTFTGLRRTTGSMDPGQRLWVYGRGGQACRRCGAAICESRQGLNARVTFHCPRCQAH